MKKVKYQEINTTDYSLEGKVLKSKKDKSYYLLAFSEHCSLKLKKFPTKRELNDFIAEFVIKHAQNKDDNWIEFIVEGVTGEVIIVDETVGFFDKE